MTPPDDGTRQLLENLTKDPAVLRRLVRRKDFIDLLTSALAEDLPEAPTSADQTPSSSPAQPSVETPQRILDRAVISTPLLATLREMEADPKRRSERLAVIIELNANRGTSVEETQKAVTTVEETQQAVIKVLQTQFAVAVNTDHARLLPQYVFAKLTVGQIRDLIKLDQAQASVIPGGTQVTERWIHRIWPDFKIKATVHKTGATIKAEAARVAFAAAGKGIVWAVMDSGIDGGHPHFKRHETLTVPGLRHRDFVGNVEQPLTDPFGHGTHVAGVIAGEWRPEAAPDPPRADAPPRPPHLEPFSARVAHRVQDEGDITYQPLEVGCMSGIAPLCKLVSYRVLDERGEGEASSLMLAIADVQRINEYGKELKIHGVNISIGYPFDPEWFACGQSPLCVAVNRLVKSGVVVVVAAGNSGYGTLSTERGGVVKTALALTINDPGNAELAITVGASHRESPHTYGVSYFSSKGPTGDGRLKPDLVAPGERVLSCAAGSKRQVMRDKGQDAHYIEDSGTSMATPHVSGAAAAFLSVQREFIGQPDRVKRVLMETATDLGRDRHFQGTGMIDVMRAIQSV